MLRSFEVVVRDENKVADGTLMQTYDAIFTIANRNGDWRLAPDQPQPVQYSEGVNFRNGEPRTYIR